MLYFLTLKIINTNPNDDDDDDDDNDDDESSTKKEAALYDKSTNGVLLRCSAFPSRALMNNPLSFEVLAYTTLSVNSASKISNMSLL